LIIRLQAKEAQAFAAEAGGETGNAVKRLKEAVAIEDSIDDLPQPPYPVIPATELCGDLLLQLHQPAEAATYFRKTLQRTPNRPKAIFGLARAAQALGDNATASERYQEFLSMWKDADPDRPEVATAKEFLAKKLIGEK
jgi:tetratricopeptide (TPR) repeat protein